MKNELYYSNQQYAFHIKNNDNIQFFAVNKWFNYNYSNNTIYTNHHIKTILFYE